MQYFRLGYGHFFGIRILVPLTRIVTESPSIVIYRICSAHLGNSASSGMCTVSSYSCSSSGEMSGVRVVPQYAKSRYVSTVRDVRSHSTHATALSFSDEQNFVLCVALIA